MIERWVNKPPCLHPGHNPPMHLYIAPGQTFTHRCPGCGDETVMQGSPRFWV